MEEIKLTKLAMRAYKNLCDRSKQHIFGIRYPYCYFIQLYTKLKYNRMLLCKCGKNSCLFSILKEKSTNEKCDFCTFYEKWQHFCCKLIFTMDTMCFQEKIKDLTIFLKKNLLVIYIYFLLISISYKCIHSKEFQKHERVPLVIVEKFGYSYIQREEMSDAIIDILKKNFNWRKRVFWK